jgi:hypothetical protein
MTEETPPAYAQSLLNKFTNSLMTEEVTWSVLMVHTPANQS